MQAFLKIAVCHREPVVLGKKLLPLCCGHMYLLHAAESPYYYGGSPSLQDLAFAVAVCSHTFEEGISMLCNPPGDREIRAWIRSCRKALLHEEFTLFERYVAEQSSAPEHRQKIEKNATETAREGCLHPWELLTVVALIPKVGESRAWNMPITLAFAYASAESERNGNRSFISEERERDVERAKSLAAMES